MIEPSEKSAPASAGSASALNRPAGRPPGKSNSTMLTGLSLPIDFLTHGNIKTSGIGAHIPCPPWPASAPGFPAKTSVSWEQLGVINREPVLRAAAADSFSRSCKSSGIYAHNGWSLKTCRRCSIQTIAQTFKQSSAKLPNAVMWDSRECWMLNISESPKNAAGYSWSQVIKNIPASHSWLTPGQWNRYLHRLARTGSQNRRMLGLAILWRHQINCTNKTAGSILAMSFSLLRRTDGIRWLSGAERLSYMGFPSDWMEPTLKKLMPPAMPCPRPWQNGLLKF